MDGKQTIMEQFLKRKIPLLVTKRIVMDRIHKQDLYDVIVYTTTTCWKMYSAINIGITDGKQLVYSGSSDSFYHGHSRRGRRKVRCRRTASVSLPRYPTPR